MDSCIYKDLMQKNQKGFVRQTNDNSCIKSNCNYDRDNATAAEVSNVLKEKEFDNCESLLTQLASSSHLRAYKNILTSFGIFFCLQTISNDFRIHKK
jgi:hypothetical protein